MTGLTDPEAAAFARYLWRTQERPEWVTALDAMLRRHWDLATDDAQHVDVVAALNRVLREALVETPGEVADPCRQWPLRAARHLRGMVDYDDAVERGCLVPDTNRTVGEFLELFGPEIRRSDFDPARRAPQARMIAAHAGNYARDRSSQSNARNAEFLRMARAVWVRVEQFRHGRSAQEWHTLVYGSRPAPGPPPPGSVVPLASRLALALERRTSGQMAPVLERRVSSPVLFLAIVDDPAAYSVLLKVNAAAAERLRDAYESIVSSEFIESYPLTVLVRSPEYVSALGRARSQSLREITSFGMAIAFLAGDSKTAAKIVETLETSVDRLAHVLAQAEREAPPGGSPVDLGPFGL